MLGRLAIQSPLLVWAQPHCGDRQHGACTCEPLHSGEEVHARHKNSSDQVSTAPLLEGVDDGPSIGLLISTLRSRKSEVSAVRASISQSTGESSMSRASHTFCTEGPVASHSNSRRSSRHRCTSQETKNVLQLHHAKSRTLSFQQEHFLRNRGVPCSRRQN